MTQTTERAGGSERHLARAMLSLASGEVVGKIATLVTLVWAARVIGVESFGVLTFGMGLGLLVAAIPSFAPTSRMIQLVGSRTETLGVRLAALNVVRWGFTVPAVAIAVPFVLLRPESVDRWTIALMVVTAVLDNTIKVWMAACTALDRQAMTAVVLVGQRMTTLALVGLALLIAPSSATVAGAFAIGALLSNVAMARLARHCGARTEYRRMKREHLGEMLSAVPVTGGSNIFSEGLARIDVILIGLIAGDAAVGLYGVAIRLMETALFVSWTLARALTPELVRTEGRSALGRPVRLGIVLLFALYVPYGAILALAGNPLVRFLFGPDYETGALLLLLSAAPLLFGLGHFTSTVLFARRPDPIVPLATGIALAVNLLLNVLLLPHLGADAAGLAKTAAFAVQSLILTIAVVKIAMPRRVLPGVLVTVAATAIACLPVLLGAPLIVALPLAGLLYCILWYPLTKRFDRETAEWIDRARGISAPDASEKDAAGRTPRTRKYPRENSIVGAEMEENRSPR